MRIQFEPGRTWSFEQLPADSIALDGACPGPRIDLRTRRYSFDHHADCLRLVTTATCQQVLDAVLLGFDPQGCTLLLNDVDGDTVLSTWLLQHASRRANREMLDRVRPLVASVAALDAHGPPYPLPHPELAAHFHAEIMAPHQTLRAECRNDERLPTAEQQRTTLAQCLDRLDAWWNQGLQSTTVPPTLELAPAVDDRGSWVLVHAGEIDPKLQGLLFARLYADGHHRLVSWSRLPQQRYRYGLAKRSDLVAGFPLQRLYHELNRAEAEARRGSLAPGSQTWGGASSVGGSPRDGSVLDPQQVAEAIEQVLSEPTTDDNEL